MSGKRKTDARTMWVRIICIGLVAAMTLGLVLSFLQVF